MKTNILIKYLVIITLLLILILIPDKYLYNDGASLCFYKSLLGFQCPLCGMTRAVHETTRFNFLAAYHYNPAVFFLPVLFATDILYDYSGALWIKRVRLVLLYAFSSVLVLLFFIRLGAYFLLKV